MKSVINKSRSSKKQFSVISIIIPFYQRNNELISLLKSLEIVKYPLKYLEIIIVQDGSKVDSDVLINYFNSYRNEVISGDYIHFLTYRRSPHGDGMVGRLAVRFGTSLCDSLGLRGDMQHAKKH